MQIQMFITIIVVTAVTVGFLGGIVWMFNKGK